jgi:Disulphide bond corrector protein DsbC
MRSWIAFAALALGGLAGAAQEFPRPKPSVTMLPAETAAIPRGQSATIQLAFRIAQGFHINSHQPRQEYLKKTELHLDAPTDIVIGKISYPAGEDRSFPFAPEEKLSVYSGDFSIGVLVRPLKSVLPTKYAIHGQLHYQACDNAACYPPKQLPVSFEVRIEKGASGHRRNPPQSPHAHS